jgi:hypothetical protein
MRPRGMDTIPMKGEEAKRTPEAGSDKPRWLFLDSRVVMGQCVRHNLFLQAFQEGRDRCSIFGKSHLISSPYVLSMMCKTLESNKSHL